MRFALHYFNHGSSPFASAEREEGIALIAYPFRRDDYHLLGVFWAVDESFSPAGELSVRGFPLHHESLERFAAGVLREAKLRVENDRFLGGPISWMRVQRAWRLLLRASRTSPTTLTLRAAK